MLDAVDPEWNKKVYTAVAHRLMLMSALRKVLLIGFMLFLLLAYLNNNWWLIPIAVIAAFVTSTLMSIYATSKVKQITGLSHQTQAMLWEHYKTDPLFTSEVDNALSNAGKIDN